MHKEFEINRTKIKGSSCHLGRKVVTHNSKSDLPLTDCEPPTVFFQPTLTNFFLLTFPKLEMAGPQNGSHDFLFDDTAAT